ncbi:unnamed protein product [Vitrella brassicaformis CCMP3155]|uniref:Chromo domain-containing protein n=1 Tax=Vitrella brassicaformis (strain CCMP3155) TaxID=1169540 RepID=A0A0G4GTS4_VITBC|nr:unnamed protein product [Vitrella brassicaformis CCMP3155]|eukprot:CEM34173.1 unnamed protein product [Vitrella brassicaformis CCMP3155]
MAYEPSLKDIQPDDRFDRVEKHEVQAVIGKRKHRGRVQYKLKWRWWPVSYATWEDEGNCTCPERVQEYENRTRGDERTFDDAPFPKLNATVRITHCKELNREHVVKVIGLDKRGIKMEFLDEPTRTKLSRRESMVGEKSIIQLKDFLRDYQWEAELGSEAVAAGETMLPTDALEQQV